MNGNYTLDSNAAYNSTSTLVFNGTTGDVVHVTGSSGLSWQLEQGTVVDKGKVKRISPKLYFSYVKSKLNKTQTKKLKARLQKLQSLVKNADETGQKALYEELSKMLFIAIRESEAAACGHDVYVNRADIDKFMNIVTEDDENSRNPIRFKKLEEFPRAIPAKIQKTIKSVQAKGLFDELWVLYLDYSGEEIKSNKQKIKEKDPILFGKFSYDEARHFFIADWIDEYCDLTLSAFVSKLKTNDEEYDVSKTEDVTPEYLERIKNEIKEREERLKGTNPSNFRDRMAEEDRVMLNRLKEENAKLRDKVTFADEDKEIAVERALKDAQLGTVRLAEPSVLNKSLPKKPWYKRIF